MMRHLVRSLSFTTVSIVEKDLYLRLGMSFTEGVCMKVCMKKQPVKCAASHLSPETGYGDIRTCITPMTIDTSASTVINSVVQHHGLQDILQVLMKSLNLNAASVIGPLPSRGSWKDTKMNIRD